MIGKQIKALRKKTAHCLFAHRKFHMDYPGIEPEPVQ
jgi:hypothetical protein